MDQNTTKTRFGTDSKLQKLGIRWKRSSEENLEILDLMESFKSQDYYGGRTN